jgi:hypothetical protein
VKDGKRSEERRNIGNSLEKQKGVQKRRKKEDSGKRPDS